MISVLKVVQLSREKLSGDQGNNTEGPFQQIKFIELLS